MEVAKMLLGVTIFAMVASAYLIAGICWLGLMLVYLPSWLMGELRRWASKRVKQ